MNSLSNRQIPWYKNYILLLIIAIPIFSMVISGYALYAAITSTQSPVLEGYYKEGLAPKERAHTALSQHISGQIAGGVLYLQRDRASTEPLKLKLEHPTLAAQDRFLRLQTTVANQYLLDQETLSALRTQHWYLRLYDEKLTWEIKGEAHGEVNGINQPILLKAQ